MVGPCIVSSYQTLLTPTMEAGSESVDSTCNEYDAAMQAALVSLRTHRVVESAEADDRKVSVTEAEARSLQRVSNHTAEA